MLSRALQRSWYRLRGWSLLLLPLAWLYGLVVGVRRLAYRRGWLHSTRMPVPVVVIGNITVGGSGKTPLTAYIARHLHQQGLNVGIVSRGYGGQAANLPLRVTADTPASESGDEPLLLAMRGDATVMIDPVRSRAAQALVEQSAVDIILADDGLQHYALARDVEIAVVDGQRGYGNGCLLPAGPLRESRTRLAHVDLELVQGGDGDFALVPGAAQSLAGASPQPLTAFAAQRIHAVAGIGAPERFFAMLREYGCDVIAHAFPDHYSYCAQDMQFGDDLPVLMTEKDAVKYRDMADQRHWFVPVDARLDPTARQRLHACLKRVLGSTAHNKESNS